MDESQIKKITVFIGSPRKQETYLAVQKFVESLKKHLAIDCEYVFLKDYNLQNCLGCGLCFESGEEFCPLNDDRDLLLEKMNASDGIVFATPNYSLQVTALMKNLLERLAFVFHRPRFFGKAFIAIVTQGIYGGDAIVKYLENVGGFWGFNVVKGCSLTVFSKKVNEQKKICQEIEKASMRFCKELTRTTPPEPTFFRLMMFRFIRTSHMHTNESIFERDYSYYKENGWFESDYYYPISLGLIKRLAGRFFDFCQKQMIKHHNSKHRKDQ